MPKLACNGFSLYANHCRPKLEQHRGRKFHNMHELITATCPLWEKLPDDEKRAWKEKAREYKKTEEYFERSRAVKRKGPKRRAAAEGDAEDEVDVDDFGPDFDPGVPINTNPSALAEAAPENGEGLVMAAETKARADKDKIFDFLSSSSSSLTPSGSILDDIKTYGHLQEGLCIPAEMAIVEWSLAGGILDEYHRLIGPWDIADGTLRDRAAFHADATHRIPLMGLAEYNEFETSRRTVLRELLGRGEPGIAVENGLGVGLYEHGMPKDKDGKHPLFPGDVQGRRWIVVLESEYRDLLEALKYLLTEENLHYEGFPTTPDRFVSFESVLETLGEYVHAAFPPETPHMMAALKEPKHPVKPDPKTVTGTPWDSMPNMYCSFHKDERTGYCALAQARKSVFTAFRALKAAYDIPFEQ